MFKLKRTLAVLAAATCLIATGGCASGIAHLPPLESAGAAKIRLAPGDKVAIAVQELEEMSGEYIIDETGAISLPLINQLPASGLSYAEMQNAIAERLIVAEIVKSPNVTVQPLELRPIYILGEVRRPGEYSFRQGMTVFAAIASAGGYTYRAKTGEVAITRSIGDRTTTGSATEDTVIMPGDRIEVFESWF